MKMTGKRFRLYRSAFAAAVIAAAFCAAAARAATVSAGTWICNPGAAVRVPVSLDGASGISGVAVTLSYDPQVVVLSRIEPGSLQSVFADDFTSYGEMPGEATAAMFTIGGDVAETVSGSVATFVFVARGGTAGQFSDVTVTKVELLEESGVRDVTVKNPVTTQNGMIRVMAADAAAARLENSQTVVSDSRLGSLALSDGDAIQASDAGTPVVVSGAVSAVGGVVPVATPDGGWATAEYDILKTTTAGLSFASAADPGEELDVVEARADGVSTYTLRMTDVDGLAVVSRDGALDATLQAYVRECAAGLGDGVSVIYVHGGPELVSLARAFGIRPFASVDGSSAEVTFAKPGLSVVSFDPKAGTICAEVRPAAGNSIAGSGKVTGIVEVLGSESLDAAMTPVDRVEIDLSNYFDAESAGLISCRATFGDNRFFQVRIADE